MTLLTLFVRISDAPQVYLAHTVLDQPVYSILRLAFPEVPIAGKVVHHAVGYHTEGYLVAHLFLRLHQTVDGIVQRRVASHDDDGLVPVVNQHGNQALHTVHRLALHEVIRHVALVQHALQAFSLFVSVSLRTIQDAPF